MSTGARVAGFVALLAVIFTGALFAGQAIDPETSTNAGGPAGGHAEGAGEHGGEHAGEHAGHEAAPRAATGASAPEVALHLATTDTRLTAGRASRFAFRIAGARGETIRDFQPEQARRMHLVVVRRDLRHFQHLHPVQGAGGGWSTPLRLPTAGDYRAYADFRSAGRRTTLSVSLLAPGGFEPRPLPAPTLAATVDGYDVALRAGENGALQFTIGRDSSAVADLQPYLGARGHLVVLRARDLAYEHVHPLGTATATAPGTIAFSSAATRPGSYRLFLQFRHRDRVHTAAFTREVAP